MQQNSGLSGWIGKLKYLIIPFKIQVFKCSFHSAGKIHRDWKDAKPNQEFE